MSHTSSMCNRLEASIQIGQILEGLFSVACHMWLIYHSKAFVDYNRHHRSLHKSVRGVRGDRREFMQMARWSIPLTRFAEVRITFRFSLKLDIVLTTWLWYAVIMLTSRESCKKRKAENHKHAPQTGHFNCSSHRNQNPMQIETESNICIC